jgi:hypothetical protein
MYNQNTIDKFIELKAKNITHAQIAAELHVSERTLNNWTKKYYNEILYSKQIELDRLKSELNIADFQHLEFYSKIIEKCKKLFLQYDFKKLDYSDIFKMFSLAVNQVKKCCYLDLNKVKLKDDSDEEEKNPNQFSLSSMLRDLKK